MIHLRYFSKKDLIASVGQPLKYDETSFFGIEVKGEGEEKITGAHRPHLGIIQKVSPKTGKLIKSKEFFATVTLKDGIIVKVT